MAVRVCQNTEWRYREGMEALVVAPKGSDGVTVVTSPQSGGDDTAHSVGAGCVLLVPNTHRYRFEVVAGAGVPAVVITNRVVV